MNNEQLLYSSVSKHNILPLTSRCGVSCLFCSHRYNPPGVRAVFLGELALDTIKDLMDMLDPAKKIVIGESATRLCEGEPFSHPHFPQVIRLLRKRFTSTPIQITTNGTGLGSDIIELLAKAGKVELIVSLNSADPQVRRKLMGRHPAERTLQDIASLPRVGIPWHASLVLLPYITGWEDVDTALSFAAQAGAQTMRLLLPGFSQMAPVDWQELTDIPAGAKERLEHWRKAHPGLPITLEPALPQDLRAIVAGVLASSPAADSLEYGDEILTIDGQAPFSRVDCFYTLYRLANPELRVRRQGLEFILKLTKKTRSSSGVVMDQDIDPGDLERAMAMAKGATKVLLLTSLWAQHLWSITVPKSWTVLGVKSDFFGGNINAAGLLTLSDYRQVLGQLDLTQFDRILLPPVSFDESGIDLRGENCRDLAKELAIPLIWS